jgi:histidinol-phosphate aminotransferase
MTIEKIMKRARPEILALKKYMSARSLFKDTEGKIFLDANECPYEPYVGAQNLSRYPDQQPRALVDRMCRLYDVSSRNLAIARGADEAIDLLVRSFCVPGKDNIVICPPTFPMYAQAALVQGAKVIEVPLRKDFSVDTKGIIKAATKNTKIIFLCSPNNPTATPMDEAAALALCEYFRDTALVVVDETYIEFTGQPSMLHLLERIPNLIILRTLSKAYAAAGLRCGVAIAHAEIIELILKVLPPYPLPQPMVAEAVRILDPKNIARLDAKRGETLARRDRVMKEMAKLKDVEKVYDSCSNFFLVKVKDAGAFYKKAFDAGVILRNQSHQRGLKNCVRITVGTEEEMTRMLAVLKGEKGAEKSGQRVGNVVRRTKETAIAVKVNLDAVSPVKIVTGIGFYDHMLEQVAKHGGFSLTLECEGDLEIDTHHTIEDCAIALGEVLKQALGDKRGIGRYGFTVPMDEALAEVAIDLGGRFFLKFDGKFPAQKVGELPTEMVEHVFRSLAENMGANVHIKVTGENSHHMVEGCFKGFGRALRQAIRKEGDVLPSTKGVL